jgi:hypothetical protein
MHQGSGRVQTPSLNVTTLIEQEPKGLMEGKKMN